MDGGVEGRERAVEDAARSEGWNWRAAVKALASEPLPPRLRAALVELGAQGHRFHLAVGAYNARLERLWDSEEEMAQPVRNCRDWPEHAERAEAREAYEEAKLSVAVLARAWVEGSPGGSS